MGSIKEITFIRWKLSPFEAKLAKTLKKEGIKVSSVTIYELKKEFKKFFDEELFWLKQSEKNISKLKKFNYFLPFIRKVIKKKYSILIGVTSTGNWFTAFMFWILRNKAEKRFYFPYDIAFFRYKNYKTNPWYVRWSEKYNFKCCNGIIHKGPDDELKYLPKEFKTLTKSSLQFLPYCDRDIFIPIDNEFFEKKISETDGETHLVYVGGVYHNEPGQLDTIDIFNEIANQKLVLHVYARNSSVLNNIDKYKKLEKSGYFKLHEPIYGMSFQKEISKYDWGVYIFHNDFDRIKREWAKTAYGNKISSYLESGLPIICNEELRFVSHIIESNLFGIAIEQTLKIKPRIDKIDYEKLVKGLNINREDFTFQENINRLTQFIN